MQYSIYIYIYLCYVHKILWCVYISFAYRTTSRISKQTKCFPWPTVLSWFNTLRHYYTEKWPTFIVLEVNIIIFWAMEAYHFIFCARGFIIRDLDCCGAVRYIYTYLSGCLDKDDSNLACKWICFHKWEFMFTYFFLQFRPIFHGMHYRFR